MAVPLPNWMEYSTCTRIACPRSSVCRFLVLRKCLFCLWNMLHSHNWLLLISSSSAKLWIPIPPPPQKKNLTLRVGRPSGTDTWNCRMISNNHPSPLARQSFLYDQNISGYSQLFGNNCFYVTLNRICSKGLNELHFHNGLLVRKN